MKLKLTFGLAALLVAGLVSCSKDEGNQINKEMQISVTAKAKEFADANETRTNISTGVGLWDVGVTERIGLFIWDENIKNRELTGTSANGLSIKFEGTLPHTPADGDYTAYAIYPYRAVPAQTGSTIPHLHARVELPAIQSPLLNSFDPRADIMYSESFTVSVAGLTAVNDISTNFTHAVAIVKVVFMDGELGGDILNETYGEPMTKFTLTNGNTAQLLTGRKDMSLIDGVFQNYTNAPASYSVSATYTAADNFVLNTTNAIYLCVYPGTLTSGSQLTFEAETENYTIKKVVTLGQNIPLPANKITTLNVKDATVTAKPQVQGQITAGWDMSVFATDSWGTSPMAISNNSATGVVTFGGLTKNNFANTGVSGTTFGWGTGGGSAALLNRQQDNTDAMNPNSYVTFTMQSTKEMSLSSLYLRLRFTRTACPNTSLQYRIGSGNYSEIENYAFVSSQPSGTANYNYTYDLTSTTALQNIAAGTTITFRIVPVAATWTTTGNWYISNYLTNNTTPWVGNALQINGSYLP